MPGETFVGSYVMERLGQLGLKSIFGVPGDYELTLLDLVAKAGLEWKGNPNELNAAYAADGYARISNGIGALVTTYGPGELSALCGIAGSYCEYVPVLHIVGYPSVEIMKGHKIMHHSLGHGTFTEFHDMSKKICCATTVLMDAETASSEIDRVLNEMLYQSQPGYIGIPTDICYTNIPSSPLQTALKTELPRNDSGAEKKAVADIRDLIERSSKPIIIVDGGAIRNQVLSEVETLCEVTNFPYFSNPWGKGAISEASDRFGGVYNGLASKPDINTTIESSDCVLWIGKLSSDFNTAEFTEYVDLHKTIEFQRFWTSIEGRKVDLNMKWVLQKLNEDLRSTPLKMEHAWSSVPCTPYTKPESSVTGGRMTQAWLWPRFAGFLQPNDILVVETGTSQIGINDVRYPQGLRAFTQTIFGSIGFAAGSSVGAFIAGKERGGVNRNILLTGDGSLQLTIQAFSDLLRHDLNPIIFILNNNGYTIERLIHGAREDYNHVPLWKHGELLDAFGVGYKTEAYQVRTCKEWDDLLREKTFNEASCAQVVEIFLDTLDAPEALIALGRMIDQKNAKK